MSVKCHRLLRNTLVHVSVLQNTVPVFPEVLAQNVANTLALTLPDVPVMRERIFYSMSIVRVLLIFKLLENVCIVS